jgi:hypothetical protein
MLLMSLATLLALDLQVLVCCPKPLPLVITASSAKVGSSQGNTWGVTPGVAPEASEEWFDSSEVLMPRAMLRLVWSFPHASWP